MAQQLIPGVRGSALRADYEEPYRLKIPPVHGVVWSYPDWLKHYPHQDTAIDRTNPCLSAFPDHVAIDMFTQETREEIQQVHRDYYQGVKDQYFASLDYLLVHTGVEWVKWDPTTPYPEPELWVDHDYEEGRRGGPMIGNCSVCFSAGKLGYYCQRCVDRPMACNDHSTYGVIWSRRDEYIYNPLFLMRLAERKLYLPLHGKVNSTLSTRHSEYAQNEPIQNIRPRRYPRMMFVDDSGWEAQPKQRADNYLDRGQLQAFANIEEFDWEYDNKEEELPPGYTR